MLHIRDVAEMGAEAQENITRRIPDDEFEHLKQGTSLMTKYLPRVVASSPLMKQKLVDVILTMNLLPHHSQEHLRLMQRRQFTAEKDSFFGVMEFSMCSVKDQDIIPLCILCNVRSSLDNMTGQLLALAKEMDSKNLGNGYNLPNLYVVGTTGDLWQFYLVTTKNNGWEVVSTNPLYWGNESDSVKTLGLLNGFLEKACEIVTTIRKGENSDTFRAREEPRPEQTITAVFADKAEKFLLLPGETVENIQDELLKGVDAREYGCYSAATGGHRITTHDKLEALKLTTIYFRKVVHETGRRHSIYS
ncbi:hypothetical protein Pelo_15263 [Pelomyxa schiedti]|nr:hypothetical protein Pelo_15263 [Pelomyxa schiedti]